MAESQTRAQTGLPLAGIGVVITRPQRQAELLAQAIETAGGEPIIFPTIVIEPLEDLAPLHALAYRLHDYDMAIFVSVNAVEQALPHLVARSEIPARLVFAAVGEATRNALLARGIAAVLAPTARHDSEALLDLPPLREAAGKRVVIFRGEGGRQRLAETLLARGARVDHALCYRRLASRQDTGWLVSQWQAGGVDAVSALSFESLQNLYAMLDTTTRGRLAGTPVLVPHPRIAEAARALGCVDVRVTGPSDAALIEILSLCRKP